jgi:hypothetical protein
MSQKNDLNGTGQPGLLAATTGRSADENTIPVPNAATSIKTNIRARDERPLERGSDAFL